ncbi:hypothetical protein GCM10011393_16630 [Sphingopyxis bauzanensis]|nr:hypothetical protein GCM10011393_16630 [Sphingopyxis bauzanensis]
MHIVVAARGGTVLRQGGGGKEDGKGETGGAKQTHKGRVLFYSDLCGSSNDILSQWQPPPEGVRCRSSEEGARWSTKADLRRIKRSCLARPEVRP